MSRNFELLRRAQHGSDPLDSITLPGESGQPAPPRYYQPPVRAAAGTIGGESEWLRAVNILRKHWQSAAAFALTVVLIVTLVTFMIRPVYAPIARIEVDPPGSEVFSMQGGTEGGNTGEYIATQARNLQSEELGMQVVRALHLDSNPDFAGDLAGNSDPIAPGAGSAAGTVAENAALKALENRLSVSRESASRLVFVSVAAHDPVQAAGITNKLVSLFVEREYEMRHQAVLQSSQWLQKQLEDIRARMEQSTSTLADFQRSSGIAAVGDNQNTFAEQMNELSRQLMQAQADRIQMQSFLNRFDGQASSSLPQISGNPVVQALTQKRAEVQAELAQSLAIYGKNHPVVRKLQNQADELQAQLVAQRAAILRDLKTSYSAAQARENLMQSEMKGAGRQLALLAQYNDLKKEADANTTLYNNLYAKIKEAGINAESKSSPIRLVDAARVLDTPTRPRRLTNIAIGILAGLFGGLVLAFVREGMDTTIHTADDMKKCIGAGSVSVVPVIGAPASAVSRLLPPKVGKNGLARVFLRDRPNSPEAEALRGLYTSVRLSQRERPPQLLLVASPFPGEGKTTVSINLAIALAQHGRTCLVDADLRKEGVAPAFKISVPYGLADVLLEKKTLDEALVPAPGVPNLVVLGTGASTLHPARLVTSDAMEELLRRLRVKFDFVLIDSPPVLPFADGRALSSQVDGVVLVGRAGMTKREAVTRAVEILQEVHSAPIQVVLNAAEYPAVDYRYYRYGARRTVA